MTKEDNASILKLLEGEKRNPWKKDEEDALVVSLFLSVLGAEWKNKDARANCSKIYYRSCSSSVN